VNRNHRGSGRSVVQELNRQQNKLGLGRNRKQCLPTLLKNADINEYIIPSLKAAVFMRTEEIKFNGFITEYQVLQAKATASLIEQHGTQMLYGKQFIKTAKAIAVLAFQPGGYTVFGLHFQELL
jgi:hypothetical protein